MAVKPAPPPPEKGIVRIGVISDTHKLLRPEAARQLEGSDLIIHAGDIGAPEVIDALSAIAPVRAVRGNIDRGDWAGAFPEDDVVSIGDRTLYVLHDVNAINIDPAAAGFDVVISGHSHQPVIRHHEDVLYLNPGSAGPRRFKLPIALASLHITPAGIEAEIHEITLPSG